MHFGWSDTDRDQDNYSQGRNSRYSDNRSQRNQYDSFDDDDYGRGNRSQFGGWDDDNYGNSGRDRQSQGGGSNRWDDDDYGSSYQRNQGRGGSNQDNWNDDYNEGRSHSRDNWDSDSGSGYGDRYGRQNQGRSSQGNYGSEHHQGGRSNRGNSGFRNQDSMSRSFDSDRGSSFGGYGQRSSGYSDYHSDRFDDRQSDFRGGRSGVGSSGNRRGKGSNNRNY